MLVDLAHADMRTTQAALKVTTKPLIISHTGLDTQLGNDPAMARMMRPRLISKQQARIVADAGGAIGVWTHLSDTPLQFARNVRALVNVIGSDHVCIGTDTKLTPPTRVSVGRHRACPSTERFICNCRGLRHDNFRHSTSGSIRSISPGGCFARLSGTSEFGAPIALEQGRFVNPPSSERDRQNGTARFSDTLIKSLADHWIRDTRSTPGNRLDRRGPIRRAHKNRRR